MNQFGDFLTNLRNSRGLTLEELATLVDSSKSTLSRLENNEIPRPYKGTVRKLIIHLAQELCTSKKETERYLTLAGIDRSLLTENEEIQLGLAPRISINTPAELHRDDILVLNFAHPFTEQQWAQIEKLAGTGIGDIITIPTLINEEEPLEPQIARLIDAVDQSIDDWNERHILINPPGYAPAALLLLAEIHGRIGHFPTLIRMRPKHGSVTSYEVVELLNLQIIRDKARKPGDTPIMPKKRVMKSLS
jgi:transcriptional regulator with XRE-family HTH domain